MVGFLQSYISQHTMYQLVVRYLLGLIVIAAGLSIFERLNFQWLEIVTTFVIAILACFIVNYFLAKFLKIAVNKESWLISAAILTLIIGPGDVEKIGLPIVVAGAAAMLSKFVLKWHNRHIFNPAAVGVLVMSLVAGTGSSWWVGIMPLTIVVILGGLVIAYKVRRLKMVGIFLATYLVGFFLLNGTQLDLVTNQKLLTSVLLNSPLIFFATIMLIEPATSPTGSLVKKLYGAFVAIVILLVQRFLPEVNYSIEIGLLAGNLLTRVVERTGNLPMTLVKKEALSPSIESFYFETSPKINFQPGQFFEWTVPHSQPDSRGLRRWFTIASSPTEKYVQLTTRFAQKSSTLKTTLRNLRVGEHIWAHGLEGDFVLPTDKTKALTFIAGGIGITPFRSMIKYLVDHGESRDITLVFAAKKEEDLIFQDLFSQASEAFGLKLIPVLSEPGKGWQGLSGTIDGTLLKREVPGITASDVYVSGPEPMVETLSQKLRDIGVPNSSIRQDFFPGYLASDVEAPR